MTDATLRHCPSCGHNLTNERSVTRGDWTLSDTFGIYRQQAVLLTPAQYRLLFALINASPRALTRETLHMTVARSPYDTMSNVVQVQAARVRKVLVQQGLPVPFEGLRTRDGGYRWIASNDRTDQ